MLLLIFHLIQSDNNEVSLLLNSSNMKRRSKMVCFYSIFLFQCKCGVICLLCMSIQQFLYLQKPVEEHDDARTNLDVLLQLNIQNQDLLKKKHEEMLANEAIFAKKGEIMKTSMTEMIKRIDCLERSNKKEDSVLAEEIKSKRKRKRTKRRIRRTLNSSEPKVNFKSY